MALIEWTSADSKATSAMGWNIFEADEGPQLQRVDEMWFFNSDDEAATFVIQLALNGSELAKKAMMFLFQENSEDFRRFHMMDAFPDGLAVLPDRSVCEWDERLRTVGAYRVHSA